MKQKFGLWILSGNAITVRPWGCLHNTTENGTYVKYFNVVCVHMHNRDRICVFTPNSFFVFVYLDDLDAHLLQVQAYCFKATKEHRYDNVT
jgi:hypothetical protein